MITAAAIGIAAVVVCQATTWLPDIGPGEPTYFAQRIAFALLTLVELPLFQTLLAGAVLLACTMRRVHPS